MATNDDFFSEPEAFFGFSFASKEKRKKEREAALDGNCFCV